MAAATAAAVGGGLAASGLLYGGLGTAISANAAGQAARDQRAAALEQQRRIVAQGNVGAKLAEATPQELAALDRSMTSSLGQLDREERLLAAIDPAIMEASQQALKILRGETAGVTSALNNQRGAQRQKLVNQLREQYGPGAELSSLGQKALQQFDMESNSLFQQSQSNALGQVFGIASSDFGGRTQRAIGGLQAVGEGYGNIQTRRLNANNAILGALSGSAPAVINSAGAGAVQGQLLGSGLASLGGNIMNTGLSLFGAGAKGGIPGGGATAGGYGTAGGSNFGGTYA